MLNRLQTFYRNATDDHRIGPTHVALYLALLYEVGLSDFNLLIPVRTLLMQRAKIRSTVTYHRCLRDLHTYGYIIYTPSHAEGRTRIEVIGDSCYS